jgi:hypothetical protein
MKPALILLTSLLLTLTVTAQTQPKSENLVLITLDGIRWQDVFRGADSSLLFGDKYMKKFADQWRELYWDNDVETRRELLMPFLWGTVKKEGQIFGNRDTGSEVSVKNPYNISYPGYSEIFTGYADKNINSKKRTHQIVLGQDCMPGVGRAGWLSRCTCVSAPVHTRVLTQSSDTRSYLG